MTILQVREQYQKENPNQENTIPAHYLDWLEKRVAKLSTTKELLLCDFFKFFRDNGEANIGMTIEDFVDGYLKDTSWRAKIKNK